MGNLSRRNLLIVAAATGAALPPIAHAQSGTVRFILPLGPGSAADPITRWIAQKYEALVGEPAIVETKPGGNSVIGIMAALAAPADGRTIFYITPSSMVVNPLVERSLPYDPQRDIRPLVQTSYGNAAIVVAPNSRFKSFQDLVAAARSRPGAVSYANYSLGYYFGALELEEAIGARFNHIPYKGAAQANTDVAAGMVDASGTDIGGVMPLIKAQRVIALAQTGKERHPFLPDVPTVAELGFSNYELALWNGFAASRKTPDATARAVEQRLRSIIGSPEFAAYCQDITGARVINADGETFSARIRAELDRYRDKAKRIK